jgi:hypothetical protein
MTAVIHSAKLLKEPVTLFRNVPARAPTAASLSPLRVPHDAGIPSATTLPQRRTDRADLLQGIQSNASPPSWTATSRGPRARTARRTRSRPARPCRAVVAADATGGRRALRARAGPSAASRTADLGVEIVFEASCKILQALTRREGVIAAIAQAVRRVRDRNRRHCASVIDCEAGPREPGSDSGWTESGQVGVWPTARRAGRLPDRTPSGSLDGRLGVQLASLRRTLLAARSESSNGDSPK